MGTLVTMDARSKPSCRPTRLNIGVPSYLIIARIFKAYPDAG
jgi:hypothetical protein